MEQSAPRVVIGMDPHKRSVTIEVMCADETIVSTGRFDTDRAGYRAVDHHDTRPRRGCDRHGAVCRHPAASRLDLDWCPRAHLASMSARTSRGWLPPIGMSHARSPAGHAPVRWWGRLSRDRTPCTP